MRVLCASVLLRTVGNAASLRARLAVSARVVGRGRASVLADREPYAHIGVGNPPVHEEERGGLTCDDCDAHKAAVRERHARNFDEHWSGVLFTSVPGGASVARMGGGRGTGITAIEHRKEFEGGMNEFIDNKKAGLTAGTTKGSVEKEYKRLERNERLVRKHRDGKLQDKGIFLESGLKQQIGLKE